MKGWTWPLPNCVPWTIPLGNHLGAFGVKRKHDIHTGVDLYAPEDHPVHAVEDGTVVAIDYFTGPEVEMPWWETTRAVSIAGESGVICYGEIQEKYDLKVGDRIKQGSYIGKVKRVLKLNKSHPTPKSMLHLELYKSGYEGDWESWNLGESTPDNLLDPTEKLVRAWARVTHRFHRDSPPPPTDPKERKNLISWLMDHPLWHYPIKFKVAPDGSFFKSKQIEDSGLFEMITDGPDWVEEEARIGGDFWEAVHLDFQYVDPTCEIIRSRGENWKDPRDTHSRVWLEGGGWHDQSKDDDGMPEPEGGWNQWNKWIGCHDFRLDCGGSTVEDALIELALRVKFFYNDDGSHKRGFDTNCGHHFEDDDDDKRYFIHCKVSPDGFCEKCGFLFHWWSHGCKSSEYDE